MKKKAKVKIHQAVMIPHDLLFEHPDNSQKQNAHEFAELRKSIRENGFDEVLLVSPKTEGEGYWIVAGNHRFRAGKAEGMDEFPSVIRDDWDNVKIKIELVRRNYVRGKIDQEAFTEAVNVLAAESALSLTNIYEAMGFEDEAAFTTLYKIQQEEEERTNKAAREVEEASSDVGAVKLLDDLGYVISTIVAKHGHTIPYSYIVFPTGNKNHMYVASNPALKKHLAAIATMCAAQNLDINIALAGILAIGLDQTGFLKKEGSDQIIEAIEDDMEGSSDLELM